MVGNILRWRAALGLLLLVPPCSCLLREAHGGKPAGDKKNASSNAKAVKPPVRIPLGGPFCNSSCHTDFEKEYLKAHAAELAPGLKHLRSPGCVPPGQVLQVGGFFRSGSTLLFNTARLWLELAFPDRLGSGWSCLHQWEEFASVKGGHTIPKTTLCKDHNLRDTLAKRVDILLMSRRNISGSLCSRVQRRPKSKPYVEKQCKVLMQMQANVYNMRRKMKKAIQYDMLLDDMLADPDNEIRRVGRAIGICEDALADRHLVAFQRAMAASLISNPGKNNNITMVHMSHDDVDKEKICSVVPDIIRNTEHCTEWSDALGSADSNAFVKK